MARSGSVDYSVTASTVITKAAKTAGILGEGQTLSAEMQSTLLATLNMMIKQWQGSADFAPGLKVWTRRRATLFLQKSQSRYLVGPTGDHVTESYTETTLTAASATSDTTITVDSISGISSGDYVGVWLDDGSVHWTTVNGAPSGNTVTITNGVASAASSGQRLVAYTTKCRRPVDILTANLRDEDDNDIPLSFLNLSQYDGINQKSYEADPQSVLFEAQLDNAYLYIDCIPQDTDKVIKLTYLSAVEDIDAVGNDFDYPATWYLALTYSLAVLACVEYGRPVPQDLRLEASTAVTIAKNQYPDTSTAFFEPELY